MQTYSIHVWFMLQNTNKLHFYTPFYQEEQHREVSMSVCLSYVYYKFSTPIPLKWFLSKTEIMIGTHFFFSAEQHYTMGKMKGMIANMTASWNLIYLTMFVPFIILHQWIFEFHNLHFHSNQSLFYILPTYINITSIRPIMINRYSILL